MNSIPLRMVQAKQPGIIQTVPASGVLGIRLWDMGVLPDTSITILDRSPRQDPVSIRVRNTTWALRNNETNHIQVRVNR